MGSGASRAAEHARVVEVLKKTPFMQMMDDKIIEEVAECFQLVTYPKGAVIKNDPWLFFIVAEGAVDISSLIPTNNRKQHLQEVLCQRKVGDYISFAAREQLLARLMDSGSTKVARKNIIAMLDLNRITADLFTGCSLIKLNRDRFLKLRGRFEVRKPDRKQTARFSDESTLKRAHTMTGFEKIHLINAIVESEIVNYLVDIPFLEGVEESRLVTLSNLCSYLFIRRGDVLCHEGEIGDRFFVCIRGSLQASVKTFLNASPTAFARTKTQQRQDAMPRGGTERIQALKRMSSGAYFGEISLLYKIPRICSITALEDSLLVYIDRVAFCNFLKIVPEASIVLLEHVRLHFLDTLIKQGCVFLNAIPPVKLQELSYVSELLEHQVDDVIIHHHEKRAAFYIVLRGHVEVEYFPLHVATARHRGGEPHADDVDDTTRSPRPREILTVRAGGYFGQEALMLGISSPVAVRALDHCLTLRLSPELFDEFFSSLPEVYSEFCLKCLRERAHVEHVMQHYEAHKLWAADCVGRRRNNEVSLFEYIEDFKWEADIAEDSIHERALVIYMKFLSDYAPMRVRVTPGTLERIERELSSQDVDRGIFQATRDELLRGMEDEYFEAFRRSELFGEFLQTLHCPQTIYDALTPELEARLDMSWRSRGRGQLEVEDLEDQEDAGFLPAVTRRRSNLQPDGGGTSPRTGSVVSVTAVANAYVATTSGRKSSHFAASGGNGSGGDGNISSTGSAAAAAAAAATGALAHTRRRTKGDLLPLQRRVSTSFVF